MEWLERIGRIRNRTRGGQRDPNKALLLLYALGRLHREGYRALRFREVELPLTTLLGEFGPPRAANPGSPFHRLAADGLWEVAIATGAVSSDPDALRAGDATGRLDPRFAKELLSDPALFAQAARLLLDTNFEPTLHEDIRVAVGLPDVIATSGYADRGWRDVALRQKVLVAYECRCAFCGYEGWLGTSVVGLSAARLRWSAFDGQDDLTNVLCLCGLHHRLLDRGVMGLSGKGTVLVSRHFTGTTQTSRDLVLALSGRAAARPQGGFPPPSHRNADWHFRQVFRGPARTDKFADFTDLPE